MPAIVPAGRLWLFSRAELADPMGEEAEETEVKVPLFALLPLADVVRLLIAVVEPADFEIEGDDVVDWTPWMPPAGVGVPEGVEVAVTEDDWLVWLTSSEGLCGS